MLSDKIATVEDALEKAFHVLAGMPGRYELDMTEDKDMDTRTKQAQWLLTQKEAINIDISIALDYIEKGIDGISSCQKGGGENE